MRRLFSFKTLILVLLAAGIGAMVALVVNQKQKFAAMSELEIRAYLDQKLGSRMSEDQVAQIQDAVVSAVKGVEDAEIGLVEAADIIEEAVEEVVEEQLVAEEAAEEAVEDAIEEAAEEADEE